MPNLVGTFLNEFKDARDKLEQEKVKLDAAITDKEGDESMNKKVKDMQFAMETFTNIHDSYKRMLDTV